MLRTVATAVCLCICDVAFAQSVPLSGPALSEMIGGARVDLDTPLGGKLPISYADDGRMTGEARGLAFYLGAAADKGRWWISANQLCQRWETWFNAEVQCLSIKKDGDRIHWVSRDGRSGTGTVQVRVVALSPAASGRQVKASALSGPAESAPRTQVSGALPEPVRLGAPSPTSVKTAAVKTAMVDTSAAAPKQSAAKSVPQLWRPVVRLAPRRQTALAPKAAPEAAPAAVPVPVPLPLPLPVAEPRFMVVNVAADDVLNVRQGPSADHDVIGSIARHGRGVEITGACQSLWCPVRHLTIAGWVNRVYLESEDAGVARSEPRGEASLRDNAEAPRSCLTPAARELLAKIETRFGAMRLVSTCRSGATIAGTGRPSKHRDGNAIDFVAGMRKQAVVEWLIAHHVRGGTMTYRGMDHIHVDIGPHFVALGAGGRGRRQSFYESAALAGRR